MREQNFGLTKEQLENIKKLNTPSRIQDFLDKLEINFEEQGETCMSPKKVLETKKAHCIEGAFFAASCIYINKIGCGKALVVDMKGKKDDWDHVIAVFNIEGKWGAISKTNHAVLRYREPVYESIRELIMSYFHEYTDDKGIGGKTLRSFSEPVDLIEVFGEDWISSNEDLWEIHDFLDKIPHSNILTKKQESNLRKADDVEIALGELVEWTKGKKKKNSWKIENA